MGGRKKKMQISVYLEPEVMTMLSDYAARREQSMSLIVEAAVASAVEGRGLTRLFSYHVAEEVQEGKLEIVWRDDDSAALPVHLITPEGRLSVPKVRRFFDFAVPRLKADFVRMGRCPPRPA